MQPAHVTLTSHTKGDTWEGLIIGPVLFNGEQPPQSLSSCRLYFRNSNDLIGYKLKSEPGAGDGTITITDAVTWSVTVQPQLLPLSEGVWRWDFETTDAAGTIRTLYSGTISITSERSYD